jgi:hypothetical protein
LFLSLLTSRQKENVKRKKEEQTVTLDHCHCNFAGEQEKLYLPFGSMISFSVLTSCHCVSEKREECHRRNKRTRKQQERERERAKHDRSFVFFSPFAFVHLLSDVHIDKYRQKARLFSMSTSVSSIHSDFPVHFRQRLSNR